jgi:predicted nucleotidyltransferase
VKKEGWRAMSSTADMPEVTAELLQEIVRRIVEAGDPLKIVLFGSRARNQARLDSDIDLLVVEQSTLPRYRRSPRYYRATLGTFPARDIVVWTPEEIEQWASVSNHFVTAALREGKVLYERPS